MSFSNPITGSQGTLLVPAIKSRNYIPGVSGWQITREGDAEFNTIDIRDNDLTLTGVSVFNTGSAVFSVTDLVYWALGNLVWFNVRVVASGAGSGTGIMGLGFAFEFTNVNSAGRTLPQIFGTTYTSFSGSNGVAALTQGTGIAESITAGGDITQIRNAFGEFIRGGHIIIGSQLVIQGGLGLIDVM